MALRTNFIKSAVLYIVLAAIVTCCSHSQKSSPSAEGMYLKAIKLLDVGNYDLATQAFDELEKKYPLSQWTKQANVATAFINYRLKKYEEALGIIDSFIKLYPTNKNVEYLIYLRSLCYFNQIKSHRKNFQNIIQAKTSFEELVNRFPSSLYALSSGNKLYSIGRFINANSLYVANFYASLDDQIGAIKGYKFLLEQGALTDIALEGLAKTHHRLGLLNESKKYYQQLKEHNAKVKTPSK